MTPDPDTVTPETAIQEVSSLMVSCDISGVPVMDRGEMVGIITKSDLMRSSSIGGLTTRVEDIMEDVITVSRYLPCSYHRFDAGAKRQGGGGE